MMKQDRALSRPLRNFTCNWPPVDHYPQVFEPDDPVSFFNHLAFHLYQVLAWYKNVEDGVKSFAKVKVNNIRFSLLIPRSFLYRRQTGLSVPWWLFPSTVLHVSRNGFQNSCCDCAGTTLRLIDLCFPAPSFLKESRKYTRRADELDDSFQYVAKTRKLKKKDYRLR